MRSPEQDLIREEADLIDTLAVLRSRRAHMQAAYRAAQEDLRHAVRACQRARAQLAQLRRRMKGRAG